MEIYVNENAAKGSAFGDPLTSFFSDPDDREILTFEVVSSFPLNDAMSVSTDHRLMVVREDVLDHEYFPIFEVTIKVMDSENHVLFYDALVIVNDVNEKPYFVATGDIYIFISEEAPEGAIIYHFDAIDPEGESAELRFEIVSQDSDAFEMDYIAGNLLLKVLFLTDEYKIRVRVSNKEGGADGKSNELDIVATIQIDYVNEEPRTQEKIQFLEQSLVKLKEKMRMRVQSYLSPSLKLLPNFQFRVSAIKQRSLR